MSCSFFSEDSICGPAPAEDDITTIPVKSCANNLSEHLAALGVSGKTQSGHMQIGETEVLLTVAVLSCPAKNRSMNLLCALDIDIS